MRGFSESTKELIAYAKQLLEADHPQTLRQLHYAIFSKKQITYSNDLASYKKLSRATTTARRLFRGWELAGKIVARPVLGIPPEWMIDETRDPETVNVWKDAAGYIETVR